MKVLITESQYKLLLEVSKKDILINKLGFTKANAIAFENACGSLAIWMAKKIIKSYLDSAYPELYMTNLTRNDNFAPGTATYGNLVNVMDYIRTGLDGNISTIQDVDYWKLTEKANEWHKSLQKGTSKIDYVEKNDIIIDYRDNKGFGFYWASLGKKKCDDEAKRMGHCGTSRGFLYSFRKYIPSSGNHTLNDSILTASINTDGELLQLKGPTNSKPTEDFYPYILDLLNFSENGKYLIDKIGYEYDSVNDFKISDLEDAEFIDLYKKRPTLFNGFSSKRRLVDLGLIDDTGNVSKIFNLTIEPSKINNYVGFGDYITVATISSGNHNIYEYICGNVLNEAFWHHMFLNYSDSDADISSYINENNLKLINKILIKNGLSEKYVNDPSNSIYGKIYASPEAEGIEKAIFKAFKQTVGEAFMNYLIRELVETMDVYGKVLKVDKNGVTIRIDLNQMLENYDDFNNVMETCETNECVFYEVTQFDQYDEKPEFKLDLTGFIKVIADSQFNTVLNGYLQAL
jgi:hypothetical protein